MQGSGYFLEAVHTSADPVHTKLRKENICLVHFFCQHHLRVTGGAFTGIVPPCQLLVEEAAEDVGALSHSSRGLLEEVSGSKTQQQNQLKSESLPPQLCEEPK